MDSLPTPLNEKHPKLHSTKKTTGSSKPVKTVHQAPERASNPHVHTPSPTEDGHSHHSMVDGRSYTQFLCCRRTCHLHAKQCDGELPCKRCKDDGLVCTTGTRKKTEYKQLPQGYVEVLENTQFALIATVHKLDSMVRNQQQWDLGEPELNVRGQPIIHNIAQKLGCIRPNSDIDMPVHSVFPEDEAGLAELTRQLEKQQQHERQAYPYIKQVMDARTDRASSSELDHSDFERDIPEDGARREQSSHHVAAEPDSILPADLYLAMNTMNMDVLNQGLLESNFGTITHVRSCVNPEVMMGMGGTMIYPGYDADQLRL
ncbi:hypothetical protein GE09DRAFT_1177266 [Coniochaeta sp. 2T2.1]|nr:hypothetical protein GE09DRAFT_1177266 [Coniochaeta sp. 2T2.1]